MPVSSLILSSKFNSEIFNGIDFQTNKDSKFSFNLIGSVMERVQIRQEVAISWGFQSSESNKVYIKGISPDKTLFRRNTGKWIDDGITIGDNVEIRIDISFLFICNVINISEDTLIADVYSASLTEGEYNDVSINGKTPLETLYYKFGLIENNETVNYLSKVSGQDQGYYAKGVGYDLGGGVRYTGFIDMDRLGSANNWHTGSAKIRYVSNTDDFTQVFELVHEFIILPYSNDEILSNIINNTQPDLFSGFNTIKYVNELDFRTTITNPNSSKISTIDYIDGSVGWFNESFDGLKSDYELNSISYQDIATTLPVDSIQALSSTRVTVVINKLSGNFISGNKTGVYMSYLASSSDYENIDNEIIDIFLYDRGFSIEGAGVSTGDNYISNIISLISGSQLTVSFDVIFDSSTKTRLSLLTEPQYIIGIQCCNINLDYDNSDNTILLVDLNTFNNDIVLEGLLNVEDFQIFDHSQDIETDTGTTDYEAWNEDGIVMKLNYNIDLSLDALINNIEFKIVAYNSIDDSYFELDNYNIPINTIVSGGVQQIEINDTRGYFLETNDQFNFIKHTTVSKVGDLQKYELIIGQKIPWQDWQAIAADTVFYDKTKPLNNLNRKSSNYSNINNYQINLLYRFNLSGKDSEGREGTTIYNVYSPDIPVNNYDTPADWIGTIETFNPENLASLEGNILSNSETLFKITWEKTGFIITDLTGYIVIHRIEVENNSGNEIYELSSLREFPSNNPLQPKTGFLLLDMHIDSGNVVTECLIDPNYIDVQSGLKLSGRLFEGAPAIPPNAKLLENGEVKLLENGEIKLLE